MNQDNSVVNQRQKLLSYLKQHGSITTSEAREKLDIYYPPARIKELRQDGNKINTVWVTWISEFDVKHRIGKYVLTTLQSSEQLNESQVTS